MGRFSSPEKAFLIGVPLAWAILLLFHPGGEADTIYQNVEDEQTAFMVVHVGMLIFIPLMAGLVYVLLRGVEGTAARISRIAIILFAIFYGAYETLQGIGVGILVDAVDTLSPAERADLVQDFAEHALPKDGSGVLVILGSLGLWTAMIAAAVALRGRAGAPLGVAILLGLSGFLISAHPPPFGPVGLGFFIVAVVILLRSESSAPRPAAAP